MSNGKIVKKPRGALFSSKKNSRVYFNYFEPFPNVLDFITQPSYFRFVRPPAKLSCLDTAQLPIRASRLLLSYTVKAEKCGYIDFDIPH